MPKNRERKPDFNSQQFDYLYLTFEKLSSGQAVSLYHWSHNMLNVGVSQLQQVAAYGGPLGRAPWVCPAEGLPPVWNFVQVSLPHLLSQRDAREPVVECRVEIVSLLRWTNSTRKPRPEQSWATPFCTPCWVPLCSTAKGGWVPGSVLCLLCPCPHPYHRWSHPAPGLNYSWSPQIPKSLLPTALTPPQNFSASLTPT